MKHYTPEEEFILRPLVWLIFHLIIIIFWIIIGVFSAYLLRTIFLEPFLLGSIAIVMATGITGFVLKIINFYYGEGRPEIQKTPDIYRNKPNLKNNIPRDEKTVSAS